MWVNFGESYVINDDVLTEANITFCTFCNRSCHFLTVWFSMPIARNSLMVFQAVSGVRPLCTLTLATSFRFRICMRRVRVFVAKTAGYICKPTARYEDFLGSAFSSCYVDVSVRPQPFPQECSTRTTASALRLKTRQFASLGENATTQVHMLSWQRHLALRKVHLNCKPSLSA